MVAQDGTVLQVLQPTQTPFLPQVIGFCGPAGSGKTTCARFLQASGHIVCRLSFAEDIKQIAMTQFGWDGEKDEAGRRLLQQIGSAGRAYNPRMWVDRLLHKIQLAKAQGELVVIDDVRFENEVLAIKCCCGKVFWVYRPDAPTLTGGNAQHASETEMAEIPRRLFDGTIYNTGTEEELRWQVITKVCSG